MMNKKELDAIKNKLIEYQSVMNIQMEELAYINDEYINNIKQKKDVQILRRLFLKNVISSVEAVVFIFKEYIKIKIQTDIEPNYIIDWSEIAMLNEKQANIDSNGSIKTTVNHQPFKHTIRFTFKMIEKVFGLKLIDFSNNNWENLQKLIERRNNITHPKSLSLLKISNDEMQILAEITPWFINSYYVFIQSKENIEFVKELATRYKNANE
jgi:hypothetical protein